MADDTPDDDGDAAHKARRRARVRVAEVQVYDRVPGKHPSSQPESTVPGTTGRSAEADALTPEPVTRTRISLARLREIALGAAHAHGDTSATVTPAAPTRVSLERLRERARGATSAPAATAPAAPPKDRAARLRERIHARATGRRPRDGDAATDDAPGDPCSGS